MHIKKTQEFLYFQNKARHYSNLRNAAPIIRTHRISLQHDQSHKQPYFDRYDQQRRNQTLINHISDIMHSNRPQITKQSYSRNNRSISLASKYQILNKKQSSTIDANNHILATKMLNMKASIGTIQNWHSQHSNQINLLNNISKSSKKHIPVYTQNQYLPQHYRTFLQHSTKQHNKDNPEMKITVQQLFQLPKLKRMRGSLTMIHPDDTNQYE